MYRHFRLTPYTNHIKCGVQDSLLVRDYFTLPKSRYTPYTNKCITCDTFKVFTHYLYATYYIQTHNQHFMQVNTFTSQHTIHTTYKTHTFLLYSLFILFVIIIIYYIIIIYLFFLPSFIIYHHIYYYTDRHTNNTLTPISLPHQRTRHPTHSPPYTYVQTIFITSLLYANTM